jgi:membrane protein implicated in regulation of membrane protease activity
MLLIGLGAFFFVTPAVLIGTLKMAGIVAWSWPWAMLPFWGIVGGAVVKLRRTANRRAARRRTDEGQPGPRMIS